MRISREDEGNQNFEKYEGEENIQIKRRGREKEMGISSIEEEVRILRKMRRTRTSWECSDVAVPLHRSPGSPRFIYALAFLLRIDQGFSTSILCSDSSLIIPYSSSSLSSWQGGWRVWEDQENQKKEEIKKNEVKLKYCEESWSRWEYRGIRIWPSDGGLTVQYGLDEDWHNL